MSQQIRIGFIGAGANTRLQHLPGFAEIEGVRLATVANRSEESSRAVAEAFSIESVASGWEAVVNNPEIDAICIGTWPYMHAEITVAALRAGKHVLTEARMASNLSEARVMHAEALAHPGCVAQIVPSPFTLELDTTIRGLIDSGTLGDVMEVFVDHAHGAYCDPEAPLSWRQDPRYSGINMLTMGIYHEAVQRWFSDPCLVQHVSSGILTHERVHLESGELVPVTLPDYLHIHGRLERGTLLNYHFSAVEHGPGRNSIKIVGSLGTLRVDVAQSQLYISSSEESDEPIVIPTEQRRGWHVEADFIDSIRTGKPVRLTSFSDGLRYMEFTESVYGKLFN